MKKSNYRKFLESKIVMAERHGFDVRDEDIHPDCFPHQKDAIRWAASLGRALIAMSFGLGKTRIQSELARLIHNQTGKKFLVICPLGVKHQFVFEDGPVLGMSWHYCKSDEDIFNSPSPFIITNYERVRDGNITPAKHDFAGVSLDEGKQRLFTAINNDCVLEMENIQTDSIDLIHTSIPFGNHYEYSAQYEDFGHNPTDGAFWKQMDFLIPELMRVLKPGRVAAIHVKDRILYGHQTPTGFMEVAPFSDECVMAFRAHGWLYEGRRTIVTDVVRENNSTYRLGWTEMTKDASKMGSGLPEYLLLFRKPPTSNETSRADEPVTKEKEKYTRARWQVDAHAFWRSDGNSPMLPAELYDYEAHIARLEEMDRKGSLPASFFAEPPKSLSAWVWDDVVYMRTLNTEQSKKRQENHICPLPFDIVERTIRLYSNEGDVVLDPFAGLFTVPVIAMKLGRIGYGIELNQEYYAAGVKYCHAMQQEKPAPTLFDYLPIAEKAEG